MTSLTSALLSTNNNANSGSSNSSNNSSNNSGSACQDFETFYHAVCTDLQGKGEVHSMSKLFSNLNSDEERMRFVLEKNFSSAFNNNLSWGSWRDFNFLHKERAESQRLRNLGNQVYQKNKLQEALEYYSQSICYAPHPPPPNSYLLHPAMSVGGGGAGGQTALSPAVDDDPNNGGGGFSNEELALGFANRSAVLFQMKEYDLCIRDITRAFDNSYPNNLMYKLFERKARCLKAIKDFPRALESMKSAEMWMKYSTLSETKSSGFKKEIAKQIEQLEEKVSQMPVEEFASQKRCSLQQPVKDCQLPKLSKPESRDLPGVREDVALVYSEEKGRHLVATEDIYPGEILIVESPYSCILLPEYYNTHCQSCYHRVMAPIPCWCCAKVRFCSDECRSEAWDRFHKVECQQLNLILDAGVGKNAMLAMRILTSSGKIYLEYVINKLREEADAKKGKTASEAMRQVGFNEDSVYDSADYRTIHSLCANSAHRGVGDLFKRSLMALYMLKILEMTPFFYNGGSDPRNVKLQDKILMGAVILKHLQNLPCNAHEISEMELLGSGGGGANTSGTGVGSGGGSSTVHEIGAGVFGLLSLLNHSCDPNVVRHYYSSNSVVRAIRTIRKGEELLDNYGYHYAVMPKEERQRKLHNQYYFHCTCTACQCTKKIWTTYASLNTTPSLLLSLSDHKLVMSDYQRSAKSYKKAFDQVLQGQFEEALPTLLDHLKFIDGHLDRPLREYNDCQEAIKQCYSAMANCYKVKSAPSNSGKKDIIV